MSKFAKGHRHAAKLTAEQVYTIRERYDAGETQGALAREYGVTIGTIGRAVRGETHQSVPAPAPTADPEALMRRVQARIEVDNARDAPLPVLDKLLNDITKEKEVESELDKLVSDKAKRLGAR